jgi:hypothetical protein
VRLRELSLDLNRLGPSFPAQLLWLPKLATLTLAANGVMALPPPPPQLTFDDHGSGGSAGSGGGGGQVGARPFASLRHLDLSYNLLGAALGLSGGLEAEPAGNGDGAGPAAAHAVRPRETRHVLGNAVAAAPAAASRAGPLPPWVLRDTPLEGARSHGGGGSFFNVACIAAYRTLEHTHTRSALARYSWGENLDLT